MVDDMNIDSLRRELSDDENLFLSNGENIFNERLNNVKVPRLNLTEICDEADYSNYEKRDEYSTIPHFMDNENVENQMADIPQGYEEATDKTVVPVISNRKIGDSQLAYSIKENILEKHSLRADSKQNLLFLYNIDGGFYQSFNLVGFETFIRGIYKGIYKIDQRLSSRLVKEIFHRLITEPTIQSSTDCFERNMYLLNVENGVVDIRDNTVKPHSPEYMFLRVIPVKYNPSYEPEAKQFFAAISRACSEKANRKFLLQAMAYLISGYYGKKIAFVFKGKGNSGKTMILNLLVLFSGGAEFVSSVPLDKFDKSFAIAEFSRKRINVVGELDVKALNSNAMVKSIIGGDTISAEFKHQDSFSFQCRIKNVFAINDFFQVGTGVRDEALFDRFEFIEFDGVVPKEERIPHFENKLFEEERNGIFFVLVKNLHKLYEKGFQFAISKQARRLKEEFIGLKNPVEIFIDDHCLRGIEYRVSAKENALKCKHTGLSHVTKTYGSFFCKKKNSQAFNRLRVRVKFKYAKTKYYTKRLYNFWKFLSIASSIKY